MEQFKIQCSKTRQDGNEIGQLSVILANCSDEISSVKRKLRNKIAYEEEIGSRLSQISAALDQLGKATTNYGNSVIAVADLYEKTENRIIGNAVSRDAEKNWIDIINAWSLDDIPDWVKAMGITGLIAMFPPAAIPVMNYLMATVEWTDPDEVFRVADNELKALIYMLPFANAASGTSGGFLSDTFNVFKGTGTEKAVKGLGWAAIGLHVVQNISEGIEDNKSAREITADVITEAGMDFGGMVAATGGGMIGKAIGVPIGGTIGSAIGGVGAPAGAAAGGIIGNASGAIIASELYSKYVNTQENCEKVQGEIEATIDCFVEFFGKDDTPNKAFA